MFKQGITDAYENTILDGLFGSGAPASWDLELFSAAPGDAAGTGTVLTGGTAPGYAPLTLPNNATHFPPAAGGVKQNGVDWVFNPATADWPEVVAFALKDPGGTRAWYGELVGSPLAFTVDPATDVFTAVGHGLTDGKRVVVRNSDGALPTGLSEAATYYVVSSTLNTFQLAATQGGAAVHVTAAGSGLNQVARCYFRTLQDGDRLVLEAGTFQLVLN